MFPKYLYTVYKQIDHLTSRAIKSHRPHVDVFHITITFPTFTKGFPS